MSRDYICSGRCLRTVKTVACVSDTHSYHYRYWFAVFMNQKPERNAMSFVHGVSSLQNSELVQQRQNKYIY